VASEKRGGTKPGSNSKRMVESSLAHLRRGGGRKRMDNSHVLENKAVTPP